ncbi:PadR family transcriptional regulator [Cellulosimicrobium terreum]|nr:PadR family transcriptional regulator [Cellulosimicrobium terreum]
MSPARLTPAATLVLSVLRDLPLHPYEILVRLRKRRDDRIVRLNPGAVYHAVERLERDGLVERTGVERDGNRPERTTYAITSAGREASVARSLEIVRDVSPEYPAFPVGLALLRDVARDEAVDALRHRRTSLAAKVDGLRELLDEIVVDGMPRRFLLDPYYELHMVDAELAWLDATIADVESGALSWTDQPSARFRFAAPSDDAATPEHTLVNDPYRQENP